MGVTIIEQLLHTIRNRHRVRTCRNPSNRKVVSMGKPNIEFMPVTAPFKNEGGIAGLVGQFGTGICGPDACTMGGIPVSDTKVRPVEVAGKAGIEDKALETADTDGDTGRPGSAPDATESGAECMGAATGVPTTPAATAECAARRPEGNAKT